ncbi:unnamed protein product [Prunus armeniaca]
MTRASLIGAHMPPWFWEEAITSAAYVSIPSHLTLLPRVFGCIAFVHLQKHQRTKLDPCAVKGYRCVLLTQYPLLLFWGKVVLKRMEIFQDNIETTEPVGAALLATELISVTLLAVGPVSVAPLFTTSLANDFEVGSEPLINTNNYCESTENSVYQLPPRRNCGKPPDRYSLEPVKKVKYPIANYMSTQLASMVEIRATVIAKYMRYLFDYLKIANMVNLVGLVDLAQVSTQSRSLSHISRHLADRLERLKGNKFS